MRRDHNDGFKTEMPVALQPNLGLEGSTRLSVVGLLNIILADEALLTIKTRSAHWNIHGGDFNELHTLFDVQYMRLNAISDEIAERVRMLGGFAIGSLQEFLDHTRLEEQPGEQPGGTSCVIHLLADQESTIRFLREDANACSDEYEDESTSDLLVGVIRIHEKMAWMLRSYTEILRTQ